MPRGRILAVDDQRYFREIIEGMLAEGGFEVQTCASGEEALRALDHAVFDVIITDMVMPVMTGTDLVQRVKERDPDQEIMVVTGVVDVKSAVDAMKIGATDYLLKPFDADALISSLESILQRSRLRQERDRLLAENIEFLGERSLFARALGLFGSSSLEALFAKLLDGLCQETGAQGGVLWQIEPDGSSLYRLAAGHGLVRLEEERPQLVEDELPEPLCKGGATTSLSDWCDPGGLPRPSLSVALRRGGEMVVLVRLTDKLGGEAFDDVDRTAAERLAQFAEAAYATLDRIRTLEQRSLQDPETGAYRIEYLHGVVRNEIEKANRFGRSFALLAVWVGPLDALRADLGEVAFRRWHARLGRFLGRLLRATDLIGVDDDGRFQILLSETDAIGAATFRQRTYRALEQAEPFARLEVELRPVVHLGCANYPGDATQLESLLRVLAARASEENRSRSRDRRLASLPLPAALAALAADAEREPLASVASLVRFAAGEAGRRPRERSLLFCRPGAHLAGSLAEGLRNRRADHGDAADLVVLADPPAGGPPDDGVTWLGEEVLADCPPFAVHLGGGASYVLVCDDSGGPDAMRMFHTSERGLAESLVFRLQRELPLPRRGPREAP